MSLPISKQPSKMEKLSTASSVLSILDDSLTKELAAVAEVAIRGYISQQKQMSSIQQKDSPASGDDEVQVLGERVTPTKPNQTVLQLGLPKDLKAKIMEQLKASGQSAGQVDLHSLFSEVFSDTMKRLNGYEITNCSLRISANGKRRQNSSEPETQEDTTEDVTEPSAKRAKKLERICSGRLNNNSPSQGSTTIANGTIKSSRTRNHRSEEELDSSPKEDVEGDPSIVKKGRGRPKKSERPKTLIRKKLTPQRCSKRLNDHSAIKDWPYPNIKQCSTPDKQLGGKKRKLKVGPHRENMTTKLLRKVSVSKNNFVSVKFFNQIFASFQMDLNKLTSAVASSQSNNFVFKNWKITHLSLSAFETVLASMGKPLGLVPVLQQLRTLPVIPLSRVSAETYNKTHLSQLSRNEFCNLFALVGPSASATRMSMRSKQPTQKFQDSPCLTSMAALSSSITSLPPLSARKSPPRSNSNRIPKKKGASVKPLGPCWVQGKLRPQYRHWQPKAKSAKNSPAKDSNDYNFLAEIAADEDEIILLEDDQEVISEALATPTLDLGDSMSPVPKSNLAVRKFPSYGWNREREARIKIEVNKATEAAAAAAAAAKTPAPVVQAKKYLDFPPFQLSGLAETAPKEVEGWFTSKVNLLRQLSEATSPGSKSSNNSSRSGSVQKKVKVSKKGRVPVKVFLDDQVEQMVDLGEYKVQLEHINSIIDEIEENSTEAVNECENNDQVISEALRVAKKIEKISISGIGRQVSLPGAHTFLPAGWHCRKTSSGCWEYVNTDGYKVKSIQAAIKHEAAKSSIISSTQHELLNNTV